AQVYVKLDELEEAKYYLEEAAKSFRAKGDPGKYAQFYWIKSEWLEKQGSYPAALIQVDSALYLQGKKGFIPSMADMYQTKSRILQQMGAYERSLLIFQKFHQIKDSVASNQASANMEHHLWMTQEMEQEKEIHQMQMQQVAADHSLEQYRWWATSLLVALLLAGGWGFALYRTQKKLKISEAKLKERDETKAQLLTILAHDMRSPMDLSRMRLAVLRENWTKFTQGEIHEKIRELEDQFSNISRLTHLLLHWISYQSGKLTVQRQNLELDYLLADELDLQEDFAKLQKIEVEFTPSDYTLYSDPNLLRFIFRNLLSNAIKFSPPHSQVKVYMTKTREKLHVRFMDQGIGLSVEKQEKLFRIDHMRMNDRGEKGYGIGLNMCQRFAKRLGGEISVESILGQGSTFALVLPLH
ncbi:MAG: ATP-binding protein, partial [Bacteroidota bacterium]